MKIKENNLRKKITYGLNDDSLIGLDVVGLWQLVVLVDMVVGVGVMMAGGDGVMVVVGVREGICPHCQWQGITRMSRV